jgi:pullulanase/glycogen debranching enzyme
MRTKVAAIGDDPETYYSINGVNISHNSYQSPDSTNAFKWNSKVNYYDYFERYVAMIELRETIDAFKYSSASVVSPNQNAKMGFWDGPLSYSTIAAWFINPDNTTYYVFANARQQVTLGNLTSNITWDGGGAKVQVLFDSTGKFPVGTQLTNTVLLESYQVLLVKRL